MEKRIIPTETSYKSRAILDNRLMELHDLLLNNQMDRRDKINANPSFVDTPECDVMILESIALKAQIEVFKNAYEAVGDILKGMQD